MHNLDNYIQEKLFIGRGFKSIGPAGVFNRTYKDIYELVKDLNEFFGDKLAKPIRVFDTEVSFHPTGPYNSAGRRVKEHFTIEFKNNSTKIRCGIKEDTGLQLQLMFKSISGHTMVGDMMPNNSCKEFHFGSSNFLEWLIDIIKHGKQKALAQYFSLDDYITEKLFIGKDYKPVGGSIVDSILRNTLLNMYFEDTKASEGHKAGIINFIKLWVKDNVLEDKGVTYYTRQNIISEMVKNKVPKDIIGNMKEPDSSVWPISTEAQWDNANIYIGIKNPSATKPAKLKVVYKNIPILVVANEED